MPKFLSVDQNSPAWLESAEQGLITVHARMADVVSYNEPSAAQAKEAGFKLAQEARQATGSSWHMKSFKTLLTTAMELTAEQLTGIARRSTLRVSPCDGLGK